MTSANIISVRRGAAGVALTQANALMDALQRHGYCYVAHPAITPATLHTMKARGKQFFTDVYPSLSEFDKESIKCDSGFRGFYRFIGASGRDDAIDCFSMGRDDVEDPAALRRDYFAAAGWEPAEFLPRIRRKNPWEPLEQHKSLYVQQFATEWRSLMREYYDACHEVSLDLLRHVAVALGIKPAQRTGIELPDDAMDTEYFIAAHSKKDHNLEVKFYPQIGRVARSRPLVPVRGASMGNPAGPKILRRKTAAAVQPPAATLPGVSSPSETIVPQIRLDTHSDLSTITILAQDALGGLEVFDAESESYVPAPVLEDAVLVNAGTFLEKWTGGLIEATPHRVRTAGVEDRCSVVFFCFPDHDARITPLLTASDNPALATDADEFRAGDLMPPLFS